MERFDRAFGVLVHRDRRRLIDELSGSDPYTVEREQRDEPIREPGRIEPVYVHLPKLEDRGDVTWGRETGEVER